MPNNIQTIIDKFKTKFPELYTTCDGREGYDYLAEDDVINFLKDSLTSMLDGIEKELPKEANPANDNCPSCDNESCSASNAVNDYRQEVINIINSHR